MKYDGHGQLRICIVASFLILAAFPMRAAELVRSEHYLPVKEPTSATADSHYLVVTWLLSQGALSADQKAALQTGQKRAEQLILKKWADANLKPFIFVNYSAQRQDLYLLERQIQADAPPGKRVSDAVSVLQKPPSLRADLNACYGFRWVKGLKGASFTAWVNNPANQRAPQWVSDRISSASRILQGKMDGQYRAMMRTVLSFEQKIDGGGSAADKANAAYQKYLYLKDAKAQFSGTHRTKIENMLPLASSQTVELGIARFKDSEYADSATLERLIALFQGTVAIWKSDATLKPLVEQQVEEIESVVSKLESGRGALWAEEFARMTEELDFIAIYRQVRTRMIEMDGMPEKTRQSLRESLWESYDIALPEAAYYWETMCDTEIKNGSRAGLAYLIVAQLAELASVHESYKQKLGPGAEDTREALADLRKKYTNYCLARNLCRVVINPDDSGAAALEVALKKAIASNPWVAPIEIVRSVSGAESRQWLVYQDGSRLAIRAGKQAPKQLPAEPTAAATEILLAVGNYPLVLAQQAGQASDVVVALNYYGYLQAMLAQIKSGSVKNPKAAELSKKIESLRGSVRDASAEKFSAWIEARRQADLVTKAEEENAEDPDEALFD